VDWCGKRTCRVGRVFPYMVYIDLNRCDSDMSNRLFVVVIM
jgi:hypothetical protein